MIDTSHIDLRGMITTPLRKVSSSRGGEYHGPCPFCGGEDRFAYWQGEQKWSCRNCVGPDMTPKDVIDFVMQRDGIGFGAAAAQLGIQSQGPEQQSNGGGYRNAQAYAVARGLDFEDLQRVGMLEVVFQNDRWSEDPNNGRPAIFFPTKGGKRWRFLDGHKPKYTSEKGFQRTWYGLDDKVLDNARKEHAPLIICNGEISAIAARFWGVPAISIAGGAEKSIPDDLLAELLSKWDGRIAICMDCDDTGRQASEKIKQQLGDKGAIINLDLQAGQDLADFVKLWGGHSLKEIKRKMPLPPQQSITHREAAQLTQDRLDIRNTIEGKPIVIPFKSWHQFGGYAKIGWPGKLTAGVGMSGHGKTSWLNTGVDILLKRGDIGVGLMPEFEGDEYHWDRLQRYSGYDGVPLITAEMMMEWELWKKENELGIPQDQRLGRALSRDEMRVVHHISEEVKSWPGTFQLFPLDSSLEEVMIRMGDAVQDRRAHGELVTFAAFDYVQILKAKGYEEDDNSYEFVLGLIKQFCMQHKIHGFVTSQVNKTADKASRDHNKILGTTDMRYIRDDKINLLVTLNILYDDLGQKAKVGDTPYYAGVANLAKNNKGRTGNLNMCVDFEHLRWLDIQWSSNQVNLLDDEEDDKKPIPF